MLCKTEYLSCASFLKVDTHVDCRRHSYVYVLKFAVGQLKKQKKNNCCQLNQWEDNVKHL